MRMWSSSAVTPKGTPEKGHWISFLVYSWWDPTKTAEIQSKAWFLQVGPPKADHYMKRHHDLHNPPGCCHSANYKDTLVEHVQWNPMPIHQKSLITTLVCAIALWPVKPSSWILWTWGNASWLHTRWASGKQKKIS